MHVTRIVQGEARWLPVRVTLDGEALDRSLITAAEFRLGRHLRKVWPEEVSTADDMFLVPLTQTETRALPLGRVPMEVWVTFSGGEILRAKRDGMIEVLPTEQRREI